MDKCWVCGKKERIPPPTLREVLDGEAHDLCFCSARSEEDKQMTDKDVTELMLFGDIDNEYLPIDKCACGAEFGYWEFLLNVYKDTPRACWHCGRRFYFRNKITIYEVE